MDVAVVVTKVEADFHLADGTVKSFCTVVESRKKAEVKYEDAVASGKTAILGGMTKT
jgi:hypothetical protein